MIHFFVPGLPATQGSKRSFRHYHTGKQVTVDSCKRNKPWRQDVGFMARDAYKGDLLRGPVSLSLVFFLRRPKYHYGTGRNVGNLKPSAPAHHIKTPDLIKLARAVEDAMKGIIYQDDSQVCREHLSKVYADDGRTGVDVIVEALG